MDSPSKETPRQDRHPKGEDAKLQVALGVSAAIGAIIAWFFRPDSILIPAVVLAITALLYFRNRDRKPARVAKSDWVALLGESTLALLCAVACAPAFEAILLAVVAASAFLLHARTHKTA